MIFHTSQPLGGNGPHPVPRLRDILLRAGGRGEGERAGVVNPRLAPWATKFVDRVPIWKLDQDPSRQGQGEMGPTGQETGGRGAERGKRKIDAEEGSVISVKRHAATAGGVELGEGASGPARKYKQA